MKKRNLVIVLMGILALSISFTSCKKNDDVSQNNQFTYEGNTYDLTDNGFSFVEDLGSDVFVNTVTLISSGVTIDPSFESFIGEGHIILFSLLTPSLEVISGTYTYDFNSHNTFGVVLSNWYVNSNVSEIEHIPNRIMEGSLEVERNGSIYEIIFNFIDHSGKEINGYYKGSLTYINVTN